MTRDDISRLVVAWVSTQQRHYSNKTRGIATPEQRLAWEKEGEEIVANHDRQLLRKYAQEIRELSRGNLDNIDDCLIHDPNVCRYCAGREQAAQLLEKAAEYEGRAAAYAHMRDAAADLDQAPSQPQTTTKETNSE